MVDAGNDAVVVGALRTGIAAVLAGVLERAGVTAADVDDVVSAR